MDKFFMDNERFVANAKYAVEWERYFKVVADQQMKDNELWTLLIRQFANKTDDCDNGWRGEYWGKLMRGGALVCAYLRDDELYEALKTSVLGLLATQDENGRISTYSQEKEFQGWDVWARKYVMLGLEYFCEICREESLKAQIINALEKHARYIMSHIGNGEGKIALLNTSTAWGAINSQSIIQPFVKLYKLTSNADYLSYADYLISCGEGENGLFTIAKENKLAPFEYPITKAYEMISCFEGILEYYEVDGKKERLTLCQAFADKLLQTDFCITGASGGRDEYFNNSTKMQVVKNDIHKFETCVTVTLMKYFASLYRATGEKKYLDAIERSFYNAYLGAMNYEKNNGYYPVPLFYSYSPVYNNVRWTLVGGAKNLAPYASFGCCIAIGAAGVGVLPTVGFVQDRDCFTLGLFIDGEYEFPSAKFRVETEYPNGGTVKITLLKSASEIRLKLRIPDWCDHVSLDKEYGTENGFAVLQKPLREGDSVVYKMDMSFKVTASQSVNPSVTDLFSISYGPNVLCADSLETDLNKPYRLQMKDGYVQGEKTANGYALKLVDGGTLSMRNYRVTGKDYYEPRAISVWLKKGDDGR